MSDFPDESITPLIIPPMSRYGLGIQMRQTTGMAMSQASITWPVANLAQYLPFSLSFHYSVKRLYWVNGSTVGGNAAIGLYNAEGISIYTSASTVTSGASIPQYVSTDVLLPPGAYYIGVAFSGTTNVAYGYSAATALAGRAAGVMEQALGALPMPASATFAAYTRTVIPNIGMTRMTTGF